MLRRLQLLGVLLGLSLTSLGCGGGGSDLLQNFVFDFQPDYSTFSGGPGLSSNPMGGIWHLEFGKALSGGTEILPAATYTFMAQAVSATKALGMTLHPQDQSSTYVEMFLNGSNISVKVYAYEPETDGVVKITANGTYDLGTRVVASTTYSVEKFSTGSKQDGTGFWEGNCALGSTATPIVANRACGVPPTLTAVKFSCEASLADDKGQGDMEAQLTLNLSGLATNTVTGSADVTFVNDEGTDIVSGTLSVSGTRSGTDLSDPINLVLSGTIGGVPISCSGNLNVSMDAENPDSEPLCNPLAIVSGELHLVTENSGSSVIRGRNFGGALGHPFFEDNI